MKKRLLAVLTIGLLIFCGMAWAEDEDIFDSSTGALGLPNVGVGNEATFAFSTGVLHIPKISVGFDYYEVYLQQQGPGFDFRVTSALQSPSSSWANIATFIASSGSVNIPTVIVDGNRYTVDMRQVEGLNFSVTNVVQKTGSENYIVVAWNDLGMHCLNPSYDTAVILPPYNNVFAQIVKVGNPPQVVTSGLTVQYRIINNTSSQGKGLFAQFWTYASQLFGISPDIDKGLNLEAPSVSNGLSGIMVANGDHFQVNGIPVVPYEDGSSTRNPYQVAEITVNDSAGAVIAQTRTTVPTSDEINCGKCHAGATASDVFNDILGKHDQNLRTTLSERKPVLCAECHGSPALATGDAGSSGKYLSQAIHGSHASRGASCYDCHPGASTQCNRSIKHTSADGNCTTCHGDMTTIASTISSGGRVPWESEPKCVDCHNSGVAQIDTGNTLYRNATGHGGVYCAGCHGSPHAMVPSSQATDNYQAIQYQGKAKSLGDCGVCHRTSLGGGSAREFASEHDGSMHSACNVCHTGFRNAGDTTLWPHQFQWKSR